MKKIAILQSNYIPWKGYFDIINMVDEFILYDDMQYTRRDWRNRNKIKTSNGLKWLTISVENKGRFFQKINETIVTDNEWCESHWKTIYSYYSKARCFHEYANVIEEIYNSCKEEKYLSKINYRFITGINDILGIKTKISWSSDYELVEGKTERLVGLCKAAGGDYYLSGPAAKDYIQDDLFNEAGIELDYMDYSNYPEYEQLYGAFTHEVSIIDLLFNVGRDAPCFMKSMQDVSSR